MDGQAESVRAAEHSSDWKYSSDKLSQLKVALSTPELDYCLGRRSDALIAKGMLMIAGQCGAPMDPALDPLTN